MFDRTLSGKRVRVDYCADPWAPLEPGSEGTVIWRDDAGTLHVKWDSGRHLGLIDGEDRYTILPITPSCYECGATKDLVKLFLRKDDYLCQVCLREMKEA